MMDALLSLWLQSMVGVWSLPLGLTPPKILWEDSLVWAPGVVVAALMLLARVAGCTIGYSLGKLLGHYQKAMLFGGDALQSIIEPTRVFGRPWGLLYGLLTPVPWVGTWSMVLAGAVGASPKKFWIGCGVAQGLDLLYLVRYSM
jgi:hypothetical protein